MDIKVELQQANKSRYCSKAFFAWGQGRLIQVDTAGQIGVVITDKREFDFVPLKFLRSLE